MPDHHYGFGMLLGRKHRSLPLLLLQLRRPARLVLLHAIRHWNVRPEAVQLRALQTGEPLFGGRALVVLNLCGKVVALQVLVEVD
jgi:hypothetical protein